MNIPNHATFTDGNLKVKNHGMYLHGFTDAAEHVSVQIRQWDIADLEYAGRLFFNHSLVEVRSEREALILELLRTSAFAPVEIEQSIRTDHIPGPITDPQMLSRVRDEIVDHVSSDEYVKIATVGIEVTPPPWIAWVKPSMTGGIKQEPDADEIRRKDEEVEGGKTALRRMSRSRKFQSNDSPRARACFAFATIALFSLMICPLILVRTLIPDRFIHTGADVFGLSVHAAVFPIGGGIFVRRTPGQSGIFAIHPPTLQANSTVVQRSITDYPGQSFGHASFVKAAFVGGGFAAFFSTETVIGLCAGSAFFWWRLRERPVQTESEQTQTTP